MMSSASVISVRGNRSRELLLAPPHRSSAEGHGTKPLAGPDWAAFRLACPFWAPVGPKAGRERTGPGSQPLNRAHWVCVEAWLTVTEHTWGRETQALPPDPPNSWLRHFTALCLSFLILENGNNVMYLPYNDVGRVK